MPVNTLSVTAAVTPTIIETYLSHYLRRGPLKHKPTAHISYHEGLELIRKFLHYASLHPVEEIQAFTSQWVPVPHWVHVDSLAIPGAHLERAAAHVRAQLGSDGIQAVGGGTWWEWRREGSAELKAEWIEMRKDMEQRKRSADVKGQRVMLYVHGGAYYFGSVDEHRYQIQRHCRKLQARALAPRYRLSPQFPFPCGLMDCLAAYLYLLAEGHDPATIILAGDSAGGGMVLTMLVVMRDQGIPLPAGAVLISPWVDLTHSFPSLAGDGKMDYIPAHGFVHKPSVAWPPPNADDLLALAGKAPPKAASPQDKEAEKEAQKEEKQDRVRSFSLTSSDRPDLKHILNAPGATTGNGAGDSVWVSQDGTYSIGPKSMLSLQLDDTLIEIKDQIQMYAPNHMLTHPLVSPVLQPSLGGLPPLLIQVGGGELLRDEQVYLAHKAAQPLAYIPPPSNHQTSQHIQEQAARYKPTNVQLQVWDDLCHVAPTLSFTRPAKHMYRGVAQFGAWALARAQKTSIDIMDDDSISFVSSDSAPSASDGQLASDDTNLNMPSSAQQVDFSSVATKENEKPLVGKAGDPIPAFENHMIRQRVDRHGRIYPLPPPSELVALNLPTAEVGVPKKGPVNKWMKAQQQWNGKFAKQKLKIQHHRIKEMEKGYERFEGEMPPPTALAGRRVKNMKKEKKAKKSWGMSLWSLWGSSHDEATIGREEQADKNPDVETATSIQPTDGATDPKSNGHLAPLQTIRSRSRSRHSTVTDRGQIAQSAEHLTQPAQPGSEIADRTTAAPGGSAGAPASAILVPGNERPGDEGRPQSTPTLIPATDSLSTRPTRGGVAYPFTLRVDGQERDVNASTVTLQSMALQSPGIEHEHEHKYLDGGSGHVGGQVPANGEVDPDPPANRGEKHAEERDVEKKDRPGAERFSTAATTPSVHGIGTNGEERVARPGVERFETAREDLGTVDGKA